MKMENSPDKILHACYNSSVTVSQAKRAVKKLKPATSTSTTGEPELVRCKRRIRFNGYTLHQPQPQQVARRNERERNRVKLVNHGFVSLRQQLPNGANNKKMSKVETLRSAVEYIRQLQTLLDENDAVNAVFNQQSGSMSPACSLPSFEASDTSSGPDSPPLTPEEEELVDFTNWF